MTANMSHTGRHGLKSPLKGHLNHRTLLLSGCLLCGTLWEALDLKLVGSRGQRLYRFSRGKVIYPLQRGD